MKALMKKVSDGFRLIFGYGILFTLFAGGATFFGYVLALCIGGDVAAFLCEVIYKQIIPVLVKVTTSLVMVGLLVMYLSGEVALTAASGKKK